MIIGVCSYGNTGSGAVFDLLKEYEELEVLARTGADFEFKFTYMPDGIEDLEHHICTSPTRWMSSDTAIKRFVDIMNFYGKRYSLISRATKQQYKRITQEFIDNIVQVKWDGRRLFEYMHRGETGAFRYRMGIKLESTFRKLTKKDFRAFPTVQMFYSYKPDNFLEASRQYIEKLICAISTGEKNKIVLDQPFSGDDPVKSFKYYNDPYAIVVDRDPRDLYITAKYIYPYEDCWIPTQSVDDYIVYYRQMRKKSKDTHDRVLRIWFEDLIYEYDTTVDKIQNFVGVKAGNSKKYFDPQISIQNTQIYKLYSSEYENIKKIERELKEWIYPFEKYDVKIEHKNIF